jgi:DNA processing protein
VNETLAKLRLLRTEGVGPLTFRRLIERHGSGAAALDALPGLAAKRGKRVAITPADAAQREIEAVAALGGRFVFLGDAGYPPLLAGLPDAPAGFALLGDATLLAARQVAIVGARAASGGGRRIAEELAEDLAERGLVVTSGLARGVDAAAHQGALRTGRTIAVIPGGLDRPYPRENAGLQQKIAERGCVVAEAPLGTAAMGRHFPKRNRIIAGLSLGIVVIEAAPQSGTLTTARMGLEAGREIFAVPGSPLDARCTGSNDLIRQGAHLTERWQDVLDHLPDAPRSAPLFTPQPVHEPVPEPAAETAELADAQAQILEFLGQTPVPVDEVLRACHLSAAELQVILTDLELDGRISVLPGNRVARAANG